MNFQQEESDVDVFIEQTQAPPLTEAIAKYKKQDVESSIIPSVRTVKFCIPQPPAQAPRSAKLSIKFDATGSRLFDLAGKIENEMDEKRKKVLQEQAKAKQR